MGAFQGLRSDADWVTDQRPKSFREIVMRLYPNGKTPLLGLTSMMQSEAVDDPQYYWWTKTLARQGGAVTAVYTDVTLVTAYTSGAVAGDTLYVKVAAEVAKEFRVGHTVLLRYAANSGVDTMGKATGVVINGASSYIAVTLREDENTASGKDLSDADTILIVGNSNPEGSLTPDAISYNPTKFTNYTQIFRSSLEITGTAAETRLRTGDSRKEAKRETLEYHAIEMEKAFWWSVASEVTGSNGKPERTTQGVIDYIRVNSANVFNFKTDTFYDGYTSGGDWLDLGVDWLDACLEQVFRYSEGEIDMFVGSGFLLNIKRLADASSLLEITPGETRFGMAITDWITPFGTVHMKTHPLFSFESSSRSMGVVVPTGKIKYRPLKNRDTKFRPASNDTTIDFDGFKEGYLTEAGLEFTFPETFALLQGLGGTAA